MNTSLARWVESLPILVGAAFLLGACGDEVGHSPADNSESSQPDEPGTIAFPDCHDGESAIEVGLIASDAFYETPSFALRADTVVVHRRGTVATNAPEDLELVAVAPASGDIVQLTANDGDDLLLDARDGALLYISSTSEGRSLVYALEGEEPVVLAGEPGNELLYMQDGPLRLVSRTGAAWLEYQYPQPGVSSGFVVHAWLDGVVYDLTDVVISAQIPDLVGDAVVWIAQDTEGWDVFRATTSNGGLTIDRLTRDDALETQAMAGSDAIYWLADGLPTRYDLITRETQSLGEDSCADVAVDGNRALFVCNEVPESPIYPPAGTYIAYWDGTELRRVAESDGYILGAAIAVTGGRATLAWADYADLNQEAFESGTVWLLRPDEAAPTALSVAPIGSGCWYCDAIWPPVVLRLEDGLLAWNYGWMEDAEPGQDMRAGVGYALVGTGMVCATSSSNIEPLMP